MATGVRFEGVVQSWNDDRGFGFIEPAQGGQPVFVHIKAFPPRFGRPQLQQRVTFEIELNAEGKKRAKNVLAQRVQSVTVRRRPDTPAQWGTVSYFAIPALLVVYGVVDLVWRVPVWFAVAYAGMSVLCFAAYGFDKQAARSGGWRVAEQTLLMLGLFGGWPGAIVAQQVLRHKSNKAAFRSAFWGSVAMNLLAFIAIHAWLLPHVRS